MRTCLVVATALCFTSAHAMAAESLSASELIEKLTAAQNMLRCSITKSESHTQYLNDFSKSRNPQWREASGEQEEHALMEMSYDGQRYAVRQRQWGSMLERQGMTESDPRCNLWLWDGARYYQYMYRLSRPPAENLVAVYEGALAPNEQIGTGGWEAYLHGFYLNTNVSVEAVLSGARSVRLREGLEQVRGSDCYVVEADTRYGKYVVWIDPEHGYNVARAELSKMPGDISYIEDKPAREGVADHCVMDITCFEEIDGVWVPMECEIRDDYRCPDGTRKTTVHHKRTEVLLNPDFEKLGAFLPREVEDGTPARVALPNTPPGAPMIDCVWQSGKPVPLTTSKGTQSHRGTRQSP